MTSCEEVNSAEQELECAEIIERQSGKISVLSALLPIILPILLMAMGTFAGLLNIPQT